MKGDRIYLKAKAVHEKMYALSGRIKDEDRKDIYNEYYNLLKRAAYAGHADAQYDLGQQYETMNYLSIENPKYNPAKCIFGIQRPPFKIMPQLVIILRHSMNQEKAVKKILKKL